MKLCLSGSKAMGSNGYGDFAGFYDCLMGDVDYRELAVYYSSLIGGSNGILLDLACGTGKLSVLMAQLGWDVIAVDSSPEMLSNAESHEKVSYICQNMLELDLYGTIDAAICSLDGLNHLLGESALLKALKRVSLFMIPGGLFAFDMNTIYKHETILGDNIFIKESRSIFCVWRNECRGKGVVDITLDIFAGNERGAYERSTVEIREKAYDTHTVRRLCEQAGFEVIGCYDFLTKNQTNDSSEKVVFLCRKNPV